MYIPPKVASKVIRTALRERAKTLHVKLDRGTAYGWITIWAGDYWDFTEEEKRAIKEVLGEEAGGNCHVISPESREFYTKKAIQSSEKARKVFSLWLLTANLGSGRNEAE